MPKSTAWLSGLLGLQLLLAGGLYANSYRSENLRSHPKPLLSFETEEIDSLIIDDGDQTLTLARDQDGWRLEGEPRLPASKFKIEQLLNSLSELRQDWPVATRGDSHHRFEVHQDNYQRKIEINRGNRKIGEIFLGTSPGMRRSHLRLGDQQDVYLGNLAAYEAPTTQDAWLDHDLLKPGSLERLKLPQFELIKSEEGWQVQGDPDLKLDSVEVAKLVSAVEALRVDKVASEAEPGSETSLVLEVTAQGQEQHYTFWLADHKAFVRRQDLPQTFGLSRSLVDALHDTTLDALRPEQTEDETVF